ncbi:MAG: nuclease-related domain-containing protein [Lysobacterales bacterium]|jgi:hypothetical protein
MDDWPSVLVHLLWIVPLLLLLFFLASPRGKGDIAQSRVRRILAAGLQKNLYTVLNDLTLPVGGGTIHVDHVVVSRLGIFVIESRYARGTVSGTSAQERWAQRRLGRVVRFDNPVHQARLKVEALQRLLDYPRSRFHAIVAFVGQSGFKGKMPPDVVSAERLLACVRMRSAPLLSGEQADAALKRITEARLNPAGASRVPGRIAVQFVLLVLLLGGAYFAFRDDIGAIAEQIRHRSQVRENPEAFHADGTPKSEQELWEDSLACAYSPDTGRCACFEPSGDRAEVGPERCRELAERGSVLKQ